MNVRELSATARDEINGSSHRTLVCIGGNGRLSTYRSAGGRLICRVQSGLLCSEVAVIASLCGDEHGCNGRWACFTDAA